MDRVEEESIRLRFPDFADVFVGREATEGLEAPGVIGYQEVPEVSAQLVVGFLVVPFGGRLLDRSVHSLDLTIGPWVVGLGQSVLEAVGLADHVEALRPRKDGVPVPGLLCELTAVVSQDGVDPVRDGLEQMQEEFPCRLSVSGNNELGNGELGCPADADEEKELPLDRLNFGDVDVGEPDGVALELLPSGLASFDVGQA